MDICQRMEKTVPHPAQQEEAAEVVFGLTAKSWMATEQSVLMEGQVHQAKEEGDLVDE